MCGINFFVDNWSHFSTENWPNFLLHTVIVKGLVY